MVHFHVSPISHKANKLIKKFVFAKKAIELKKKLSAIFVIV